MEHPDKIWRNSRIAHGDARRLLLRAILGAVVAFADKAPDGTRLKSPRGRFLRYTFAPGWGGIAGVGEAGRGGIQLPRKIIIINYLFLLDV